MVMSGIAIVKCRIKLNYMLDNREREVYLL